MFGRQERLALLLLGGVAVAVILSHIFLVSVGNAPFARPFSGLSADGELVVLEGIVEQAEETKNGGHILLVINNSTVFIPSGTYTGQEIKRGNSLVVYGIVQTYRGKKEIIARSADDIQLVDDGQTTGSFQHQ